MEPIISNEEKKRFLKWFTRTYELKRRESLWILDYLFNHDIMLEKTHFVENVNQTSRGIYMSVKNNHQPAFRFYKNGHTFRDAMQAFHEIRLNWSSELYIELAFEGAWQTPEYLAVLEDNPNASWNENIPEELREEVDDALSYETLQYARQQLLEQIDSTLLTGEELEFTHLTEELREIEQKIEEKAIKE